MPLWSVPFRKPPEGGFVRYPHFRAMIPAIMPTDRTGSKRTPTDSHALVYLHKLLIISAFDPSWRVSGGRRIVGIGCPSGIRTPICCSRGSCPTVERTGNNHASMISRRHWPRSRQDARLDGQLPHHKLITQTGSNAGKRTRRISVLEGPFLLINPVLASNVGFHVLCSHESAQIEVIEIKEVKVSRSHLLLPAIAPATVRSLAIPHPAERSVLSS